MTRAIDSNILIDLIVEDSAYYDDSAKRLEAAADGHPLVVTDLVYAEVGTLYRDQPEFDRFLQQAGISVARPSPRALYTASQAWRVYRLRRPLGLTCSACGEANRPDCARCNKPLTARQRMIADFVIGAHAFIDADGLITRDSRHFKTYFPDLRLI